MRPSFSFSPIAMLARCLAIGALVVGAIGCAAPADAVDTRSVVFDSQSYRIVTVNLRREDIEFRWRDPASAIP